MQASWLDDGTPLTLAALNDEGVYNCALGTEPSRFQPELDRLKSERGYITQDEVALAPDMPNLQVICDKFKDEHLHDEDEVRFVLDGEGVFDIRSRGDRWMHVVVEPGDLIVVPEKRHHRFLLTDEKRIRCVRLFKDQSGWVPHYRT